MKLSELERANLEIVDLKLKLLNKGQQELNQRIFELQTEGNEIIQKFCTENNLDITKVNLNIQTGEVTIIEDKKEA